MVGRALAALALGLAVSGCGGEDQPPGAIRGPSRSPAAIAAREAAREAAAERLHERGGAQRAASSKRILFGDLHVHTTYSIDAFVFQLPFFAGEGAHPPADACDFARYCAGVDFFSLNDHAEGLTPERWRATIESLRDCNARAGEPSDPDLVAFLGYEWTQVGTTRDTHYGHKNVIFRGLGEDQVPARPIAYLRESDLARAPPRFLLRAAQWLLPGDYADFLWWIERMARMPQCARGVDTRELPADCRETAATPAELFEKLEQAGLETLVIPHGLGWGIHTPRGTTLDHQLTRAQHRPDLQRLIEIWSGHGNSEEFRDWRSIAWDAAGEPVCPEARPDFLPCCRRAEELARARCGDLPEAECEARAREARRLALEAAVAPHLVFPDTTIEDWLDCDQCRDCFKPAFAHRPRVTSQYAAAIRNFRERDANGDPLRFRFGFISSSDNHTARPGTGYKQYDRFWMTDGRGVPSAWRYDLVRRITSPEADDPRRPQPVTRPVRSFGTLLDTERVASFMYPGGLVAVHADGRDRGAIWDALSRREVYGTSGPRMLLWFDLLNAPGGRAPMGSAAALSEPPRFEVRAVGGFLQEPGCPQESRRGLGPGRLERLCRGECHHPGDERHPITSIEVIRIRPQIRPGEDVADLIEDPWLRLPCEPDPAGCVARFEDAGFPGSGRDAVYYVRALQEKTPAVNGANLRPERDASGEVVRTRPCYGDFRTPYDDDCLAPVSERAWSSPIYVDQPRR